MAPLQSFDPQQVLREVSLGFYFSLLTFYAFLVVRFAGTYRSSQGENKVPLAVAWLFASLLAGRVVLLVFDYYLTQFDPSRYQEHLLAWKIGSAFQNAGILVILVILERQLFHGRDKNVFALGFVAGVVGLLLAPTVVLAEYFQAASLSFTAFIPIGYIYLFRKSSGVFRLKSACVLVGFILFASFSLIVGELGVALLNLPSRYWLHLASVFGKLVGGGLIAKGY